MRGTRGHWRRYREMAEVLARHGFFMVLDGLGLSAYLPVRMRMWAARSPARTASWSARIKMVLMELGPTYVKLGQLASMRPDMLPPALAEALEQLQDEVAPFPFAQVVEVVERAWGMPVASALAFLDPEPLAAASIGQVHRGRLIDGRAVVVKVRRPGIVEQAEADFGILLRLAEVAERRTGWGTRYAIRRLAEDLIEALRTELDFLMEAGHTDTARRQADPQRVRVPEVIWPLTRSDVLVLEEISGVRITDRGALEQHGLDPRRIAGELVHVLYRQIFVQGFFHADPHPGNVHVDAAGRLVMLDWGLVGVLTPIMRRRAGDLIMGLIQGNSEHVVEALLNLGVGGAEVSRADLQWDVERLRRRYYDAPVGRFSMGEALGDLIALAHKYSLRVAVEYALLAKTAVTVDGVVRRLDPDVSLMRLSRPFLGEIIRDRLNPESWLPEAGEAVRDWGRLAARLPAEIGSALEAVRAARLSVMFEHRHIDRILGQWERFVNRAVVGLMLGALILGAALVVHRDQLDKMVAFPFGEYVFWASLGAGAWMVASAVIRRKL